MALDTLRSETNKQRLGLIKDQVQLVKRKDAGRYEMVPIRDKLSFEKGFYVVVRACQMLVQKNDGLIFIGLAGPSGAGKSLFAERILDFMPSAAVISMDNYNDASRLVDGNFDDPRLTDYDTLLQNIRDMKDGKQVEIPIYDFKASLRTGYRTLEIPSSRIVIIEGIYALSEKLQPLLDLRVSVTGGVHFDLVKRVLRDIQRAGQEPQEIIHQISETVYPMYKAFIEPDLQTAHIKIINKFNPFSGFQSPTYILKSTKKVTIDHVKSVMLGEYTEVIEQIYDIYLLPPGEDPESCQSYLRMRNKDGKYNLMFEEWVTDPPFIISPRITFEVSVRLLGGLMALGYKLAAILKRNSHVFTDERICVKIDQLEQLNRQYVQVLGKERVIVKNVAEELGLDGSFVPRTYIQQIQLEKLVNDVMALPDDLRTRLSIDEDLVSSPKEALSRASLEMLSMRNDNIMCGMSRSFSTQGDKSLSKVTGYVMNGRSRNTEEQVTSSNQGEVTQLSEQISTLNNRMDKLMVQVEELNNKFDSKRDSSVSPNGFFLQPEVCNGSVSTSYFIPGLGNSSLPNSLSCSQLTKESPLMEEITNIGRAQRKIGHQLENLGSLMQINIKEGKNNQTKSKRKDSILIIERPIRVSLILTLVIGGLGIVLFKIKS
ncbi:inorganic pyrophosphatase TTM2-like [Impatiens glandulifera]|uniref:inorganic pyrophosphatase TTM2-like n=1 Tax=Impatiens glandulifera TaxID=253017 RepID=UPI001FB0F842|nr:inorganic pyrophosphatase TTM2-like [Impatiens glandulifera]